MKKQIATLYGITVLCSAMSICAAIQEVKTIEEYRAVVGKSKPVIIKIYTDTCPNCVEMKDIFIATAREHGNEAVFIKVNAATQDGQLREILKRYATRGVPTFVLHPAGASEQGVEKIVGARPSEDFKESVRHFLQKQGGARTMPTTGPKPMQPAKRMVRSEDDVMPKMPQKQQPVRRMVRTKEERPQSDVSKRRPAKTCPTCR